MTKTAYFTTSWDDGHPADLRIAELLAKYGVPGTFYVPRANDFPTMATSQLRELSSAFELGAHTLHHWNLNFLTNQEAQSEIAGSKTWLEEVSGQPCSMFCAPRGHFSTRHLHLIRAAGFAGLRTTEMLSLSRPTARAGIFVMPTTIQAYSHGWASYARNTVKRGKFGRLGRCIVAGRSHDWAQAACRLLREAIEHGGVFHLWGHSWELDATDGWDRLEEVLRCMAQFSREAVFANNGSLCRDFFSSRDPSRGAVLNEAAESRSVATEISP